MQRADDQLLRVNWPSSAAADVKALVRADGPLIGDLQALDSINSLTSSSWLNQLQRDGNAAAAAANIVRADLGLPSSR